jgi:hypothetical protein
MADEDTSMEEQQDSVEQEAPKKDYEDEMIPKGIMLKRLKNKDESHAMERQRLLEEKEKLMAELNNFKESGGGNENDGRVSFAPDELKEAILAARRAEREEMEREEKEKAEHDEIMRHQEVVRSHQDRANKEKGEVAGYIQEAANNDNEFKEMLAKKRFSDNDDEHTQAIDDLLMHLSMNKNHTVPVLTKLLSDKDSFENYKKSDAWNKQRLINDLAHEVVVENSSKGAKSFESPFISTKGAKGSGRSIRDVDDEDEYRKMREEQGLYRS